MSNTKCTRSVIPAPSEELLRMLETLPGALFVVDDDATIVYANASAQTFTGATRENILGKSLWCGARQLVSTALYQAIQQTTRTRIPTEVEYVSPMTRNWLHVQLAPTVGGQMVQVHQGRAAAPRQEACPQGEHLSIGDLDGLYGIIVLTPEGTVLEINEIPLEHAQIRREEIIGQPLAEARWWSFYPTSQAQLRDAIARASRGETVRFETVVRPREGLDHYLDIAIIPRRDVNHRVGYLVMTGLNITARKCAEAEIHALIDALPQLVWTGQPDGYIDSYSQSWCDYTGMTVQQAQGDGWMQCTHPDDQQRVLAVWQHAVQAGQPYETEQRLRHRETGAYRWFLMQATPLRDAQGTILKYVGTCTDIDDRKQAELLLKESEENWHALAETMPQLVWIGQPGGSKEYFNQRWFDYTQATNEQMREDGWLQFLHPDDHKQTLALGRQALETGEPYEIENRLKQGKTGAYRWFLSRALPVRDETGQIVKWFGTCTDIEEQKRTEEALRQSQERARVLMNSNIIGITISEGEQIVEANETFLRMTGYTQEDLQQGHVNWMNMTPPEYLARAVEAHRELITRQSVMPYEKENICKDGSRLPVIVGRVVLQHYPSQTIGFVLDNSARKELEQRKDNFISMASHELRNPLTALKLQITLLHRQLARQGILDQTSALASMETQIQKVTRLVEELLDVSKIQAGRLEYRQETVDFDSLLREITETMQQTHPSHRILVHGAAQTSLIGDPDRLGQVFINLLSNAIKYSPNTEIIEMDLSTSEEAVTVRVTDHGLGIPREQLNKVFERFYRVADPRRRRISGLGMGLYIVAEIVKGHGGTITVDSTVGKGSTFTVILPRKKNT